MKAYQVWHVLEECDSREQFNTVELVELGFPVIWAEKLTEEAPASTLKVLLTLATMMRIDYSKVVQTPGPHTPFAIRTLIVQRLVLMALRDLKLRADDFGVDVSVPDSVKQEIRQAWPGEEG